MSVGRRSSLEAPRIRKVFMFNEFISRRSIDHIYTNEALEKRGFSIENSAAYYSDHDVVSIYVKK